MLELKDLTIKYDDKTVLEHFNLSIGEGEIVSLVGESGSGKTTVIRSIMNLLPSNGTVSGGDILFEGKSILNMGKDELLQFRGKDTSMVFQDCGSMLNPIQKVGTQFIEYIKVHEKKSRKEAYQMAKSMLELTHLPDCDNVMKSYPFELSGGMRQRVGIAMAVTFHPKLLLADEPTSALDVTTQAQIVQLLLDMKAQSNTGIIMVTHNLAVASYISDRIIVMKDGKIVEQGYKDTIVKSPSDSYTQNLIKSIPTMEGKSYV